jgi:hypothetical protein
MRKELILVLTFFIVFSTVLFSKDDISHEKDRKTDVGLSLQVYPAGFIATLNAGLFLQSKSSLMFRLGSNITNRKDYSPYNDNEKGGGFGGSLGYRRHFPLNKGEIIAGIHTDLWNMWINWKDDVGEPSEKNGQTYTLVLQPWIEAGYMIDFKNSPVNLGITTGFGREINIVTKGNDVGQGWINSILILFQYSIKNKISGFRKINPH